MISLFYVASIVAVIASVLVIIQINVVHALIYLVLSLLSIAVVFFSLGAPFVAVLEAIVYAGAIMVLFLFVVMMLNLGHASREQEAQWLSPSIWLLPSLFAGVLFWGVVSSLPSIDFPVAVIGAREVGLQLFGPYVLAVELASFLLLAGLISAYHIAKR